MSWETRQWHRRHSWLWMTRPHASTRLVVTKNRLVYASWWPDKKICSSTTKKSAALRQKKSASTRQALAPRNWVLQEKSEGEPILLTAYPHSPCSFWLTARISTSELNLWEGLIRAEVRDSRTSRHSAHAQSEVRQMLLAERTKRNLSACSKNQSQPEVAILGAHQKERWLRGRELNVFRNCYWIWMHTHNQTLTRTRIFWMWVLILPRATDWKRVGSGVEIISTWTKYLNPWINNGYWNFFLVPWATWGVNLQGCEPPGSMSPPGYDQGGVSYQGCEILKAVSLQGWESSEV